MARGWICARVLPEPMALLHPARPGVSGAAAMPGDPAPRQARGVAGRHGCLAEPRLPHRRRFRGRRDARRSPAPRQAGGGCRDARRSRTLPGQRRWGLPRCPADSRAARRRLRESPRCLAIPHAARPEALGAAAMSRRFPRCPTAASGVAAMHLGGGEARRPEDHAPVAVRHAHSGCDAWAKPRNHTPLWHSSARAMPATGRGDGRPV